VAEIVTADVDGVRLPIDDADDLLATIVPPEVARYFFFDGERIRELAEWGIEDESALFQAVGHLLGLGVLEQLKLDLARLMDIDSKTKRGSEGSAEKLEQARARAKAVSAEISGAKARVRKLRGLFEKARTAVKQLGALQSGEIAEAQERLGALFAERKALLEEFDRAAHDVLPLLCAKTLRARFGKEIETRLRLEEREIVAAFVDKNKSAIKTNVAKNNGKISAATIEKVLVALKSTASNMRLAAAPAFPDISRADATWMQRIIERDIPELAERTKFVHKRLVELDKEIAYTDDRLRRAPSGDPSAEAALAELERHQRALVEEEKVLEALQQSSAEIHKTLEAHEQTARLSRQEAFRAGRLALRGQLMNNVLEALPTLTERMQRSKEERFAGHLASALEDLWHKPERLANVVVSFAERRIELYDANGVLPKSDLSAGEKQLFAIAQLSGSRMPLVIDTPLGRLDKEHRRRFVSGFLPTASHQVVLLSTDTEIVGSLYEDIEPLLAHHHELAAYNGGVTKAVTLSERA
jgi:DNA sulfur modification protein DndD